MTPSRLNHAHSTSMISFSIDRLFVAHRGELFDLSQPLGVPHALASCVLQIHMCATTSLIGDEQRIVPAPGRALHKRKQRLSS